MATRRARAIVVVACVAWAIASGVTRADALWGRRGGGANAASAGAADDRRVCFVAATVPWTFGAYQAQALGLSKAFADNGYETFWMPRVPGVRLPPGEYADWRRARERFTGDVRAPTKAEQKAMEHLTFLGVPDVHAPYARINELSMTMKQVNEASSTHRLDAFVLLMDIGQMYFDGYDFAVPVVLWMPYHHEEADASVAVVRTYSGVAALSDTTGRAIATEQPLTRTIPHFIDRASLNALADSFETKLKIADDVKNRRKVIRRAVFDSKKYDRMFSRSIDEVDDDTFLVLMQGGNYENSDRKGWVASINAFAEFQRANPKLKTHLWIHTVDSAMTQNDLNHKSKPPVAVLRTGISLRAALQRAQIPSNMYTLDENLHDKAFTSALKRHADVCLHTSKSEGFGMVVLECQALGTPVVTTNYTAMRDYTKYGLAVEIGARESIQGAYFAAPSVPGGAAALTAIATGAASLPLVEDVYKWIDEELSLSAVFTKFESLLGEAKIAHAKRTPWSQVDTYKTRPLFTVTTDEYPRLATWDTPWTLYHHPGVEVDYDTIQRMLIQATSSGDYYVIAVAQTRREGVLLPFDPQDGVHNINPYHVAIVRTWMLRQFQEANSYIWSSVYQIMQTCGDHKFFLPLPEGLANIKPNLDPEIASRDEL
jgi:glycosyltransferase involved in cell wall biosynthesis